MIISISGKITHLPNCTNGHTSSDQKLSETTILFPKKVTGRCLEEKEYRASIYEMFPHIFLASNLFNSSLLLGNKKKKFCLLSIATENVRT